MLEQSHTSKSSRQRTTVTTLEPLRKADSSARQAAIDTAKYNFDNSRVLAPFDARVTNLTLSQGAYATVGRAYLHPHRHPHLVGHRQLP